MQSNRHHPLNYVGRCSVSSGNGSPTSRLKSSEPRNLRNIDHIFTSSHPARCTTCGLLLAPTRSPTQGEVRDRRSRQEPAVSTVMGRAQEQKGQQLGLPQEMSLHLKCRLYAMSSSLLTGQHGKIFGRNHILGVNLKIHQRTILASIQKN